MTRHARRLANRCDIVCRRVVIAMVRGYQIAISPLLGPHCRFRPTCSQYCIEVIHRDGVVRGGIRAIGRIARCHPWNPGGYDPP